MRDESPHSRGAPADVEPPTETSPQVVRPALFPYASTISADQVSKTSVPARRLVGKALLLCRPRLPGRTLQGIADREIADLARQARELLASQPAPPIGAAPLNDDEQLFDTFFGIERHASPDALAIGIAWGLLALVHEAGRPHTLRPAELTVLTNGFFRLAAPFLAGCADESRSDAAQPEAFAEQRRHSAFERWKNGHIMFVALTDGLILAHMKAISAIGRNEPSETAAALHDASCMLSASAVAMRLSGDMSETQYDEVRALMSPPHVPRPLSGLFNSDHRQLLRLTKSLGACLQRPAPELAWAREEYWHALNDAYSGHRWVCQQLVRTAPSIAGMTRGNERPAYEEIEGFAKRALHFSGCIHAVGRSES